MPYRFTFDLRRLPREFFEELMKTAYEARLHKRFGDIARTLVKKFRIQEFTGLNLNEAISLLEDFLEIQALNVMNREKFNGAKEGGRKVLLLPHCSRKYMDNRCKAIFDPSIPTYICQHCSPDCLINQAVTLAEERGYDVYVIPGGSCVPKILASKRYEAVVGGGVWNGAYARLSGYEAVWNPGSRPPTPKEWLREHLVRCQGS